MPSLKDHQSTDIVKALVIGDTKAGKTGGLVSLVKAGYKLRILDLDNLLDILRFLVLEECPENIDNVEYRTLRDKRKMGRGGPVIDGPPRAFSDAIAMLDLWKYDDVDYGKPAEWGPDCILVIDSLSRLCDAAYDWREPLTPRGKSGEYDNRATYGDAQDAVEATLALLTSKHFHTNVLVLCHGVYMDLPDGSRKIFPQGVGQKLSPKIPQYFSSYIRVTNVGGKRTVQCSSTSNIIDLANPKKITKSYPLETGYADFFEELRSTPEPTETTVSTVQLKQLRRL